MTPNLTPHLTPHLTHEQLCDLILACSPHPLSSDFAALEQHLRACPACSEELTRLSRSLTHFREASTAFAQQQLAEIHAQRTTNPVSMLPAPHTRFAPALWLSAAAILSLAAIMPLRTGHGVKNAAPVTTASASDTASRVTSHTVESDEAFLEEIDQAISTTVPSPMQPLADPTAGRSNRSTSTQKEN
jgi:hypothetical protein